MSYTGLLPANIIFGCLILIMDNGTYYFYLTKWRVVMSIGIFVWTAEHWHFMAYMLQKAVLFRYTI